MTALSLNLAYVYYSSRTRLTRLQRARVPLRRGDLLLASAERGKDMCYRWARNGCTMQREQCPLSHTAGVPTRYRHLFRVTYTELPD
jgi:hypothetical protein